MDFETYPSSWNRKLKKPGNTKNEKPRNTTTTTITIDNTITITNAITITITIWHTLTFTNANLWRRTCFEESNIESNIEYHSFPSWRHINFDDAAAEMCRRHLADGHSQINRHILEWTILCLQWHHSEIKLIAQWLERWSSEPNIAGSSPGGSIFLKCKNMCCEMGAQSLIHKC